MWPMAREPRGGVAVLPAENGPKGHEAARRNTANGADTARDTV